MSSVDPGKMWITGVVLNKLITFHGRLGEGSPKVTSGYGGWETRSRPRKRAITTWVGKDPIRVQMTFLINNLGDAHKVEHEITQLERLAGIGMHGGTHEPPVVRWAANAPHDIDSSPALKWVIETLEWDDSLGDHSGERIRQGGTITFMQYIETQYADQASVPSRSRAKKHADKTAKNPHKRTSKHKFYTVKSGDTLSQIAARQLGHADRWKEIAKLNNIRDPRKLRVGQRLRMP